MNSDMDMNIATFAQRQEYASSLKDYKILADFDGLLVAIDKNHPSKVYCHAIGHSSRIIA